MLVVLFGAMITGAIIFVVFWLTAWSSRDSDHLKIKFSDFRNWYAIAPKTWYVSDGINYVRKESWHDEKEYHGPIGCYFGPIDYLRFVIWRCEKRSDEVRQDTCRAAEKLLRSVQFDIDTAMSKVQKDREDVLGTLKRVAENPEPPSPVEDFLKIWRGIKIH